MTTLPKRAAACACCRDRATANWPSANRRLSRRAAPAVLVEDVGQRTARVPAFQLQHRRAVELLDLADAQHRDRLATLRHAAQFAQPLRIEHRHPARTDTFGARGQPEILDRAGGRCQVHLRHGAAAEDEVVALVDQSNHQHFGAGQYAFHFQLHEFVGAFAQRLGGQYAFFVDVLVDLAAQLGIDDADKAPRLHQPDAGTGVGGGDEARKLSFFEWTWFEMAHVAPLADGAIDAADLFVGVGVWVHFFSDPSAVSAGKESSKGWVASAMRSRLASRS